MDRAIEVDDWLGSRCFYAERLPFVLEVVAEVLTRLPDDVLERLTEKGTFLIFPAIRANFTAQVMPEKAEMISFVVLASFLEKTPPSVGRGIVAHELAHIYLGHDSGGTSADNENELAADTIASQWGFAEEITALNDYYPRSAGCKKE